LPGNGLTKRRLSSVKIREREQKRGKRNISNAEERFGRVCEKENGKSEKKISDPRAKTVPDQKGIIVGDW